MNCLTGIKLVKRKEWKWIHTTSCPILTEYCGPYKLRKYCSRCLRYVLYMSSSDWSEAPYVEGVLKYEDKIIRTLQEQCIKKIIEYNIQFTDLPIKLKNQIQYLKDQ